MTEDQHSHISALLLDWRRTRELDLGIMREIQAALAVGVAVLDVATESAHKAREELIRFFERSAGL